MIHQYASDAPVAVEERMDHLELAVEPRDPFDGARRRPGQVPFEGSLDHLAHEQRIRAQVRSDTHPLVAAPESSCGIIADAREQSTMPTGGSDRRSAGRLCP